MRKLLLLLILALSLTGCTFKPKEKQPTPAFSYVGWKNYENKNFAYTMHYPHDWFEITKGLNPPAPTMAKFASVSEDRLNAPHVFVEVLVIARKGRTLDNFEEIQDLVAKGHVARKLSFAGSPAVLVDRLGEAGEAANVYVEHKDYFFRLSWDGTHPDVRKQFKDKSLQVIASLRFLD